MANPWIRIICFSVADFVALQRVSVPVWVACGNESMRRVRVGTTPSQWREYEQDPCWGPPQIHRKRQAEAGLLINNAERRAERSTSDRDPFATGYDVTQRLGVDLKDLTPASDSFDQ
jgi:hypothetical protein